MPEFDLLVAAFTTLLVVVDPLGLAPIFLSLTGGADSASRRQIAWLAAVIAFGILTASVLAGGALLGALGISLPAFRVAGGLLLFYTAFEMVFERRAPRKNATAAQAMSKDDIHNIAAFPLAVPLMAGPGAIAACILIAAKMDNSLGGSLALIGIAGLVCLLCVAVFVLATPIDRLLGTVGRTLLSRLLGVILAALAVQFIADGVRSLVGSV
ncbi:MAG: MarC family protein [Pseudomonadota bacterium]